MFFKKSCPRCDRKISKDFEFCPSCGTNLGREKRQKDFGFLGQDDSISLPFETKMPFQGLFDSLLKQIDGQFKTLDKELGEDVEKAKKSPFARGISINISSGTGQAPKIQVQGFSPGIQNMQIKNLEQAKPQLKKQISEEQAKKLAKLPRQEAKTKVRRLSNRVIYEIDVPGVSSLKDVMINKLENSIEIKAFSQDKVYVKLLPIKMPLVGYKLEDEKLVLELASQ
ncbi:MAG: hypothetical protein NT076_02060 [Candidatus Pacearchaeota archaeon]|nr:hypothetical protein [Candidatus Pacearchaeota archaeon]